jgi:hypothetical protein
MEPAPIVAEIHAIRAQIAARFNYDSDAILKDARERDAKGDRKVVSRPPRRPEGGQEPAAEPATKE